MTRGYLAIGHGLEPDGTFDPGAVSGDVREYDLAAKVVTKATEMLAQNGVEHHTESSGGPGHDPDYRGSVSAVNDGHYDWALEVHFDYNQAPRGGFGLYVSQAGSDWADLIRQQYAIRNLQMRDNQKRTDLYFLNGTKPPALIWECDRVGADVSGSQCDSYGLAVAEGTMAWLRARGMWVPQGGGQPAPEHPAPPSPAPAPPRPDTRPSRPYPGHVLKLGSPDHANVRAVQSRLHDLGYGIMVDGSFGPQTDGIVRDFQRDQKIGVDGVVGPETWGRMFK